MRTLHSCTFVYCCHVMPLIQRSLHFGAHRLKSELIPAKALPAQLLSLQHCDSTSDHMHMTVRRSAPEVRKTYLHWLQCDCMVVKQECMVCRFCTSSADGIKSAQWQAIQCCKMTWAAGISKQFQAPKWRTDQDHEGSVQTSTVHAAVGMHCRMWVARNDSNSGYKLTGNCSPAFAVTQKAVRHAANAVKDAVTRCVHAIFQRCGTLVPIIGQTTVTL